MLKKPTLALTRDRSRLAQVNETCGDPEEWFDSEFFRSMGIYAASFDFFVNWENESICDEVWIKRISDSEDIQQSDEDELIELISNCDGRDKSRSLYHFLRDQGMREKYMLFRDVPEERWGTGEERVVEFDLTRYKRGSINYLNAGEIQSRIRELRRTPAPIGNAGLIYSTSSLEGYLSRQRYFWPGDADTVLYDDKNNVVAVIEFKKHTARSHIPFSKQGINNYLKKDILKYKSLALLRDRFHTRLFVLYYPIPQGIDYVIIEELCGPPAALYPGFRRKLDLPQIRNAARMRDFAENFMRQVIDETQED